MLEKVEHLKQKIENSQAANKDELERYRVNFISRKSQIADLFSQLKEVPADQKKLAGKALNDLKNLAQEKFQYLIAQLDEESHTHEGDHADLTLPPVPDKIGTAHPLTTIRRRIIQIFERIGFNVSEGPEIEDDWHNFTALNFPENHPAREMQDTFFIEKDPDIAWLPFLFPFRKQILYTSQNQCCNYPTRWDQPFPNLLFPPNQYTCIYCILYHDRLSRKCLSLHWVQ